MHLSAEDAKSVGGKKLALQFRGGPVGEKKFTCTGKEEDLLMEDSWLLQLLIEFSSGCLTKFLCECFGRCLGRNFSKCFNIWLNLCLSKNSSRVPIKLVMSLLQFSVKVPNRLTTESVVD